MSLPDGASISALEEKRVADALAALETDPHAPRAMTIEVTLNVHREYPKHVTVGTGDEAKTVVVNSPSEEVAALGGV